jgi:hypothetical protein
VSDRGPQSWRVFYIPTSAIPTVMFDTDLPLVLLETAKADYDHLRAALEQIAGQDARGTVGEWAYNIACEALRSAVQPVAPPTTNPGQMGECNVCKAAYYHPESIGEGCAEQYCGGTIVRNATQTVEGPK